MSKLPIITRAGVPDSKLKKVLKEFEEQGYVVVERKKTESKVGSKTLTTWDLKLKLNSPPPRPNRVLVDR